MPITVTVKAANNLTALESVQMTATMPVIQDRVAFIVKDGYSNNLL